MESADLIPAARAERLEASDDEASSSSSASGSDDGRRGKPTAALARPKSHLQIAQAILKGEDKRPHSAVLRQIAAATIRGALVGGSLKVRRDCFASAREGPRTHFLSFLLSRHVSDDRRCTRHPANANMPYYVRPQGGITLVGLLAKRKHRNKVSAVDTVVDTLRFALWLASFAGGCASIPPAPALALGPLPPPRVASQLPSQAVPPNPNCKRAPTSSRHHFQPHLARADSALSNSACIESWGARATPTALRSPACSWRVNARPPTPRQHALSAKAPPSDGPSFAAAPPGTDRGFGY